MPEQLPSDPNIGKELKNEQERPQVYFNPKALPSFEEGELESFGNQLRAGYLAKKERGLPEDYLASWFSGEKLGSKYLLNGGQNAEVIYDNGALKLVDTSPENFGKELDFDEVDLIEAHPIDIGTYKYDELGKELSEIQENDRTARRRGGAFLSIVDVTRPEGNTEEGKTVEEDNKGQLATNPAEATAATIEHAEKAKDSLRAFIKDYEKRISDKVLEATNDFNGSFKPQGANFSNAVNTFAKLSMNISASPVASSEFQRARDEALRRQDSEWGQELSRYEELIKTRAGKMFHLRRYLDVLSYGQYRDYEDAIAIAGKIRSLLGSL